MAKYCLNQADDRGLRRISDNAKLQGTTHELRIKTVNPSEEEHGQFFNAQARR